MAVLSIDDNKHYNSIAQILTEVFDKKNKKGEAIERVYGRCGMEIRKGRQFCCIWLAEEHPKGGWACPKSRKDWLNIPDHNEKAFTQIELNKKKETKENKKENYELAVFVHKKVGKEYPIFFYGIFKQTYINKKAGVFVHKRIKPYLDTDEWKAQQ
jgi:hypothetical protein